MSRVNLIVAPQTIGPFNGKISSLIAKILLKKSSSVFVRDDKSYRCLEHMGVYSQLVSDVAFGLPFDIEDKKPNAVGINISGLLWHGGYTKNNQFGLTIDYQCFIKKLIDGFLLRDKKVHLISHVIADDVEVEDDYRVCCAIKDNYKDNESVVLAPKFNSPISAKSYISTMSFFTGSRMHATIAAISSGVPTVPIAYSRKFEGVFGSIGYGYTLKAYENTDTDTLLMSIFELYDSHFAEMQAAQQQSALNAKQINMQYFNFLKEILV